MGIKKVDKPCSKCGKVMNNVDCSRKYCYDCIKKINQERSKVYKENKKSKEIPILTKEYEENFIIVSEDVKNLIPYNFNKVSNKKVKSYCQYYNCNWIEVIKLFNKYEEFYEYLKSLYVNYYNETNKRDIRAFAKVNDLTYEFMSQLDIKDFMNNCNIKRLRYKDEDYKDNFDNIKKKFNRIPLYNEFEEYSKMSFESYAYRFHIKGKVYDSIVKMYSTEEEYEKYLTQKKEHKTKVGTITGAMSVQVTLYELETEFKNVFNDFYNKYGVYPSRRLFNNFSKHDDSVYRKRLNKTWSEICSLYGYKIQSKYISETYVLKSISKLIKLEYTPQKTWSWLIGNGGKNMYCDGYFEDIRLVVEFDGKQHRMPISKFGGEESFKRTQENDKLKEILLKEHNIKVIRIDSRSNWMKEEYLKDLLVENNILSQRVS